MKISFNWLKDYISPGISAERLADKMTMAGLEVEAIHTVDGDKVFEIEVTPNRADCLNMIGVAREVAAILNKSKKTPKIPRITYPKKKCGITIEDKKGCQRYIGTVIENVHINEAAGWMKKRLSAVGIRSVNNIVDITNFCLMETGQPLHAFDYDKLEGGKIIVRRARKGEKIVTIDDQEHKLDESVLVIADAKKAVAIAGIMGGKETEVTQDTKNILLESAYFDPVLIRRASRKLSLASDSSYRFERGVDINGVKTGSERAASLMAEITKGVITQHKDVQAKASKRKQPKINVSVEKINSSLGANVTSSRCRAILKKLDFKLGVRGKDKLTVTPPSSRADVHEEADIVEEIARIEGYDKLPVSFPTIKISDISREEKRGLREKIVQAFLIGHGISDRLIKPLSQKSLDDFLP